MGRLRNERAFRQMGAPVTGTVHVCDIAVAPVWFGEPG